MKSDDWPQPEPPPKRKRSKTDHIVIETSGETSAFVCQHCGDRARYLLPLAIPVWLAMCNAFVKIHRHCKPGPNGSTHTNLGQRPGG